MPWITITAFLINNLKVIVMWVNGKTTEKKMTTTGKRGRHQSLQIDYRTNHTRHTIFVCVATEWKERKSIKGQRQTGRPEFELKWNINVWYTWYGYERLLSLSLSLSLSPSTLYLYCWHIEQKLFQSFNFGYILFLFSTLHVFMNSNRIIEN